MQRKQGFVSVPDRIVLLLVLLNVAVLAAGYTHHQAWYRLLLLSFPALLLSISIRRWLK